MTVIPALGRGKPEDHEFETFFFFFFKQKKQRQYIRYHEFKYL